MTSTLKMLLSAVNRNTTEISMPKNGGALIHGIAPYKEKKGEEFMNEKQLEHFREILNSWKTVIVNAN